MYTPDFLIIPYVVKSAEGLRPSDSDIFAVIYWYEHLKDGRCTASNEAIARIACCGTRNVRAAITRLEKHGFIECVFQDPGTRMRRKEIRTLVRYQAAGAQKPGLPGREPKTETPGEYARRFFDADDDSARNEVVEGLAEKTGAPVEAIQNEVRKFILYWTEPNKSGTKVRWEQQSTFDVKRRLYTWLSRAKDIQQRAGSGVTI